jgi:gas vesicle protein
VVSNAVIVGLIGTLAGAVLGSAATLVAPWLAERTRQRSAERERQAKKQVSEEERQRRLRSTSREKRREGAIKIRVASGLAVKELARNLDIVTTPSSDYKQIEWPECDGLGHRSHSSIVLPLAAVRLSQKLSSQLDGFRGSIADICRLRHYVHGAAEAEFLCEVRSSLEPRRDEINSIRSQLRDLLLPIIETDLPSEPDEPLGAISW